MRLITTLLLAATATIAHAQLVINEVDYDQPVTDTHEFIELKNTGTSPFDLGTVEVWLVSGGGVTPTVYRTLRSPSWGLLPAQDYFVICGNGALTANCDFDTLPDQNLVENGPTDAIALIDTATGTILDVVSYEGSLIGYVEGTGNSIYDIVYGGVGSSAEYFSMGRWPDGSDTDNNDADFVWQCVTPGATNLPDTISCSVPTSVPGTSTVHPALTLFSNGTVLWMHATGIGAVVAYEVFAADGRMITSRTVSGASPTWAWEHGDLRGHLLVRASGANGAVVRRVVVE